VHGDLNGSNILIDPNNNVWLIDFFYTERTHVLKDIAKMENEILFLFTSITNDDELDQGIRILKALLSIK
jgi:Ser/Thr protein kinase RdoA (MazF antagonist)